MSLLRNFVEVVVKMFIFGSAILLGLCLVWYLIPQEVRNIILFYLLCGGIIGLGLSVKSVSRELPKERSNLNQTARLFCEFWDTCRSSNCSECMRKERDKIERILNE